MAGGGGGDEGFERGAGGGFFHVPQRSRRDKLRINNNPTYNNNNNTDQHDHQTTTTTTIISAAASASASPSSSSHHHHHHHQNHGHLATAIPFFDPSSLLPAVVPTHLLSNQHLGGGVVGVGEEEDQDDDDHHNNRQSQFGIKEEDHHHHHQVANLMGFLGGGGGGGFMINTAPSSSSSQTHHHHHHPSYLLDPQSSSFTSNLNPNSSLSSSTVHHHHHINNNNNNNNNNPFLYTNPPLHHHHNFSTTRDFDHHQSSSFNNGSGGEVVQQGLSLSLSSSLHTHRNPLELNQQPSPRSSYEHHQQQQQQQQQHQSSSLMMMIDNQKSAAAAAAAGYASRGGGIAVVSNNNFTRGTSPHPLGPFTGYALILKESRFLKPAQQLLEEFCAAGGVGKGINYMERRTTTTTTTTTTTPCSSSSNTGGDAAAPSSNLSMDYSPDHHHHLQTMESLNCSDIGMINENTISTTGDPSTTQNPTKKTRLISMLDEVYRRYKQYYQQLLAIIASFETVTGLGNAAPYTTFALKSMSKHFRCLKNAITDQLHFTSKDVGEGSLNRDHEHPKFGTTERHVHSHKPPHKSGILDHQHVWRPQRGLPERAVAVLRAWLFEHFLHPYPTDTDKQMLAKQTGLSRSQVSNWFINARVRLWKPMVEEIHMLETRESQKGSEPADQIDSIKLNEPLPMTNPSFSNEHPQTNLMHKDRDSPQKRIRNEPLHIPDRSNDQMNFSYNNFPSQQHVGPGVGTASGNSGVSLTLGLRQNNGIGLSEPFPMIAHRFGLEGSNEEYGLGSFETTNRHYGKDIGGQLLHDFVG